MRALVCVSVCLIKYNFAFADLYSLDCENSGAIRNIVSVVPHGAIAADVEATAAVARVFGALLPCEKDEQGEGKC